MELCNVKQCKKKSNANDLIFYTPYPGKITKNEHPQFHKRFFIHLFFGESNHGISVKNEILE